MFSICWRPNSGCVISLPLKAIVTLTLSPSLKNFQSASKLYVEVMLVDVREHLNPLQVRLLVLLRRFALFLRRLVLVFSVIGYLADRRLRLRATSIRSSPLPRAIISASRVGNMPS